MSNLAASIIRNALKEDLGRGDLTTLNLVPQSQIITACIRYKEPAIICGLEIAKKVFKTIDTGIRFKAKKKDGQDARAGEVVAKIYGAARSILMAERVALNFLQRLSGIATLTNKFVKKVRRYRVKIYDTRKTTPNLRFLEKYAVRKGGGFNHRMNLTESVIIKDNHLKCIGGRLESVIKKLRKKASFIEIEAGSISDVKRFVKLSIDAIMLDNFPASMVRKAVKLIRVLNPHLIVEVSGGVNLDNVEKYARSGIDRISIGALTHSFKSIDISLECCGASSMLSSTVSLSNRGKR